MIDKEEFMAKIGCQIVDLLKEIDVRSFEAGRQETLKEVLNKPIKHRIDILEKIRRNQPKDSHNEVIEDIDIRLSELNIIKEWLEEKAGEKR